MKAGLFFSVAFMLLMLILGGCSDRVGCESKEKETTDIDLVAYLSNSDGSISGYNLTVELNDQIMKLSSEPLFTVSGGLEWMDQIYPVSLLADKLVLREHPVGDTGIPYCVAEKDALYYKDYIMSYDEASARVVVEEAGEIFAVLPMATEEMLLTPQAFFVNPEGKIAVLANTIGSTYDQVYPVTLLYTKEGNEFILEKSVSYQDMFEENDFSKVNEPMYVPALSNVYGNGETETFLWNETTKIVELDPFRGTIQVLLNDKQLAEDLPEMDMSRDFLEFFSDVGYQNEVYITSFPNYNDSFGTNIAFYSENGKFLGHILCTENAITLMSSEGIERDCILNNSLCGLLYIPQFPLH